MIEILHFIGRVANHWLTLVDFPALLLMVMVSIVMWALWRAQKKADFNIEEAFKNDEGKVSATAIACLLCFAVQSWAIAYDTIKNGVVSLWPFVAFGIFWSGAKIIEKFVGKWDGKTPWSKGD